MNPSAPLPDDDFAVCPHCWHVNGPALRLCARCMADMSTLLQESGGQRATAPAQSPMPVRGGRRLSRAQRWAIGACVALLALAQLAIAFGGGPQRGAGRALPVGVGLP